MCSLDGRSGVNTGAIPGEVKRASLEESMRWKVLVRCVQLCVSYVAPDLKSVGGDRPL